MVTSWLKLGLAVRTSVKDDLYLTLTAKKLHLFAGRSRADWSGNARIVVAVPRDEAKNAVRVLVFFVGAST